jgi:hypothetical protein
LRSFSCRFEEWSGDTEGFDAAFLISTIEHIGLGAYGEGTHDGADGNTPDRALLLGVRQALRPDGRLILTTPCADKADVTELERIYDEPSLFALLDGWNIHTRVTAVRRDVAVWEVAEGVGSDSRGVAMVVASPAADG